MEIDKVFIGSIIDSDKQKYLFLNTNFYLDNKKHSFLAGTVYSLLRKSEPNLTQIYGNVLYNKKFGVQYICEVGSNHLYSFPTRYHFKDSTNLMVFRKSCAQIVNFIQSGRFDKNIPLYIPIILQNTHQITFDDLIQQAKLFFEDISNIHLILCWGNLD